ncbi:hypothetical protein RCH10_005411 [Variovorax sp. GrIS 2.14]
MPRSPQAPVSLKTTYPPRRPVRRKRRPPPWISLRRAPCQTPNQSLRASAFQTDRGRLRYIEPIACARPCAIQDGAETPSTISLKQASTIAEIRSETLSEPALRRPSPITNRASDSERFAKIADCAIPDHWEGDLIIGLSSSTIGTLASARPRLSIQCALAVGRMTISLVSTSSGHSPAGLDRDEWTRWNPTSN